MNKGLKGVLATLMVTTSVVGTGAFASADTVKDVKDDKELSNKKDDKDSTKVYDDKFHSIDEERAKSEENMTESLEKLSQYEKEIDEIKDNTAELKAELKRIETKQEELKTEIEDNEKKNESLNNELIKLGNERTALEKEKEDYIELLNDRLSVFFKNNQDENVISLLQEGSTINDVLDNFKKMNNITESDLEVIEELLNIIQDIEEKESEIKDKIEEINKVLDKLNKDYRELEDLEIKTKLIENELNIERQNVEELIKNEELNVQKLRETIKTLDDTERQVLDELEFEKNNISMTEYREYLKEYRENVELTKERIEKDKERLEELIKKKEEEEKLLKEYRDVLYDLKDYNEDLILEREKELEEIVKLKQKYEKEFSGKKDKLSELEKLKGTSEDDLEALKKELKELEDKIDKQDGEYEELVFDTSILDEIDNKKLDIESKEKELTQLKREYNKAKLTKHEEDLIKELEQSIKKYESELSVFTGKGFIRPTYGNFEFGHGPRNLLKGESFHYGIDISNKTGTPILSVYDGKVVGSARNDSVGYGNYIIIEHQVGGKTMTTLYGHMSARGVKVGDTVKQGEVIGLMGSTGWSTGPHLHFEIYNGKKQGWSFKGLQDPMNYYENKDFSKSNLYNNK